MSQLTIQPKLTVEEKIFDVLQIFVNGMRYTNLKQYAAFLNIQQEKESRETHNIDSVVFSDIFLVGGVIPPHHTDLTLSSFKNSIALCLELDVANVSRTLWLTDEAVVEWTLLAKTAFAKDFRKKVVIDTKKNSV